jgi:hypothetical protein
LYCIWAKPGVGDELPFLKGGQVRLEWGQVQRSEDGYDFSELDRQLERFGGTRRVATVELNAYGRMPGFLFNNVPYLPEKLSTYQDARGTLEYWHPAYVKAYTDAIAAFARAVKASPYRSRIVGVRLNYNAIGTEHMILPLDKRDPSRWTVPPGVEPAPPWSEEIATVYRQKILEAFLRNFSPEIRVFMRSHLPWYPGPDEQSLRAAESSGGNLGFFYTASDIEAKTPAQAAVFEKVFLEYCRSGKMVCYGEQVTDSEWKHPPLKDTRWCTPEQWNYWRLLSDLNLGFSLIGNHGADIEKADRPEYRAAFEFASRYAGYHASPSTSPGAWVALREGSLQLRGDYTFLMRRLPGAQMKAEREIGPEDQRFGAWALTLPKGARVEFAMDPDFARSLRGERAAVRVTFLDHGSGGFTVRAASRTFREKLSGSERWQTVEFELDGTSITAGGAHIAIDSDPELTLHMIEVAKR